MATMARSRKLARRPRQRKSRSGRSISQRGPRWQRASGDLAVSTMPRAIGVHADAADTVDGHSRASGRRAPPPSLFPQAPRSPARAGGLPGPQAHSCGFTRRTSSADNAQALGSLAAQYGRRATHAVWCGMEAWRASALRRPPDSANYLLVLPGSADLLGSRPCMAGALGARGASPWTTRTTQLRLVLHGEITLDV